MPTALETAIQFAKRGWYVFPIRAGTKYPYKDFHWRLLSTNDPKKVVEAGDHPLYAGCNWALDCGKSGCLVLDIDIKAGKNGVKTIQEKGYPLDPAETQCIVQTPSGGYQYYFTGSGPNSSETKLGAGLDTRGAGGYVLIPGSVYNGTPYRFISENPPPPAPGWLTDILGSPPPERSALADVPLVELDQPHHIQSATQYLTTQAPDAIEGSHGDQTTYQVACRLKDMGLTQDTATTMMWELWNPIKAHPPWQYHEIERKVRNAYTYGQDPPGMKTPEAFFPAGIPSTDAIRCAGDLTLAKLKPRDWILGYRYLPEYLTVTLAPGGVGKSLLVILEALAVATGRQLTYDKVHKRGPVWIYNTEDPFDELDRRIMAASKYHGIAQSERQLLYYGSGYDNPLKFVVADDRNRPVIIEPAVQWVIEEIKRRDVILFVVDPFIECHQIHENDNSAVSIVAQTLKRIAKSTGCAISLVHHVSKGKYEHGNADKSRGASALISAARIAHTFYPMSEKEADTYDITPPRHQWFVRLDPAKNNLSAPTGTMQWFEMQSVRTSFESLETTGTLKPAYIKSTVDQSEMHQAIIEALFKLDDKSGAPVNLHQAAKKLHTSGVKTSKGSNSLTSLRRALQEMFWLNEFVIADPSNGREAFLMEENSASQIFFRDK
jgi:hypothetical protein